MMLCARQLLKTRMEDITRAMSEFIAQTCRPGVFAAVMLMDWLLLCNDRPEDGR